MTKMGWSAGADAGDNTPITLFQLTEIVPAPLAQNLDWFKQSSSRVATFHKTFRLLGMFLPHTIN